MSDYRLPSAIQELIEERMATGQYVSEEELLREALCALAEQEQDLAAVREAVAEMEAGDQGLSLESAFEELRTRHGISRGA